MVRKNLWDRHEQAVLLAALQEVLYNNCDREKMIVDISRQLRQRAIANGDKIDDKFRNETGIRLQMLSLDHIFTNGKSGINKPNKWNSEIIHIYRDDCPYFQYVLHDGRTLPALRQLPYSPHSPGNEGTRKNQEKFRQHARPARPALPLLRLPLRLRQCPRRPGNR